MSQKAIREYDGKLMLSKYLQQNSNFQFDHFASVNPSVVLSKLPEAHPWLLSEKLVAKPDQLIKRRGKAGLVKLNATWEEASKWIEERRNKEIKVERVSGVLDHFLIEPFYPHAQSDEFYVCIHTLRNGDEVLFYHEGGVDVGDVDAKASRMLIPIDEENVTPETFKQLISKVPESKQGVLAEFLVVLYSFFVKLNYSYLEINPIVVTEDRKVVPLDLAAKIDETAKFECGSLWGRVEFPPPFGRPLLPAEHYISELDSKTGASLKLTVLNEHGRVWTMVAGGGASVIYADTLVDLGAGEELANYGEYSGAPDENMTFEYARTILELMTKEKHPEGKILLIGGGIANFTNIAATFKGIIRALTKYADILREHQVRIYVRRAGPNYQEGLELMKQTAQTLSLPIEVFGPETHMTAIVSMALGKPIKSRQAKLVPEMHHARTTLTRSPSPTPAAQPSSASSSKRGSLSESAAAAAATEAAATGKVRFEDATGGTCALAAAPPSRGATPAPTSTTGGPLKKADEVATGIPQGPPSLPPYQLFTNQTRAFIYGMQPQAVQNMLDFDFICGRTFPSLAGMVYPFTANHYMKFYWRTTEVLIPVYQNLKDAIKKHPEVDVVVNFSSFRSVYESTNEVLGHEQIKTIAIIAEGVPERQTRSLIHRAKKRGVTIIGPATVGGIKPGCFRIGNTGGMLDNIIASRLYRPGSVAYVARSGGMSNELNNIIASNSDGVYEGVAIGGDRYPGTTFVDHLLRYEANPDVKVLVVLGEVGGIEEYEICNLIKAGKITKPMVAWCIGTCAKIFPYEVQFGHAGACATGQVETADAKNSALKAVGVRVPHSFEDFGVILNELYVELVEKNVIQVRAEPPVPSIPVDYEWANKLGLIRKPSAFVSSIVDERGEELIYAGMKISDVINSSLGLGDRKSVV